MGIPLPGPPAHGLWVQEISAHYDSYAPDYFGYAAKYHAPWLAPCGYRKTYRSLEL